MILSQEQIFSDSQVVTATGESTNTIDLGAPGTPLGAPVPIPFDIGKGRPIPIEIRILDVSGIDPTLDVTIEVDDNPEFASPTTVKAAPQVAPGVPGDRIAIDYVPRGTSERYLRLFYTVGGTTPSYTLIAGIALASKQPL